MPVMRNQKLKIIDIGHSNYSIESAISLQKPLSANLLLKAESEL